MEDSTGPAFVEQKWRNNILAGFTNSGAEHGDKLNSLMTMSLFAAQHAMIWINLGLLSGKTRNDLNGIGSWLGAMAQSDNASPDVTPKNRRSEHSQISRTSCGGNYQTIL